MICPTLTPGARVARPRPRQLPARSFANICRRHPHRLHKSAGNLAIGAANLFAGYREAGLAEVEAIKLFRVAQEGAVAAAADILKDGTHHRLRFGQALWSAREAVCPIAFVSLLRIISSIICKCQVPSVGCRELMKSGTVIAKVQDVPATFFAHLTTNLESAPDP